MIPPIFVMGEDLQNIFFGQNTQWKADINFMKNVVIGSDVRKIEIVKNGAIPILIDLLSQPKVCDKVKLQLMIVLSSLMKVNSWCNIETLLTYPEALTLLFKGLENKDCLSYRESCGIVLLQASLYIRSRVKQSPSVIERFCSQCDVDQTTAVSFVMSLRGQSVLMRDMANNLVSDHCKTEESQNFLWKKYGGELFESFAELECSSLRLLASICYQNTKISQDIVNPKTIPSKYSKPAENVYEKFRTHLTRNNSAEIQIIAAKCITNIFRAGAIKSDHQVLTHTVLATLVRHCHNDKTWKNRVEAAETLSYLIEASVNLQRLAAISNHILINLIGFFKFPCVDSEEPQILCTTNEINAANDLKQAAFRVFASLAANDELIRTKITRLKVYNNDTLMTHIIESLSSSCPRVQLSSLRCLHSLSRSVTLLRTAFLEFSICTPIYQLLKSSSTDTISLASSILCNILLDFSPNKKPMLDQGIIELLVGFTKRENLFIRLNGIWALMNIAFKENADTRSQILSSLGADQLFQLLLDPNTDVLLKTLGLLRNLLSSPSEIDEMMSLHGTKVIQSVVLILEGDNPAEVKEQALCILTSVADGNTSKSYVMDNDDILNKIVHFLSHKNAKLQISATYCITNLVKTCKQGDPDLFSRLERLNSLGVRFILTKILLNSSDPTVYLKAKAALDFFPEMDCDQEAMPISLPLLPLELP